jgi:hypothetical protein
MYLETGQRNSHFNADGSIRQTKPKYGNFAAKEEKHDLTVHQKGAAGELEIYPKSFTMDDQAAEIPTQADGKDIQWRSRFTFAGSDPVTSDFGQLMSPQKVKFVASSLLGVSDTAANRVVNVELIQTTDMGKEDIVYATGVYPEDRLQLIYKGDADACKPFKVPMKTKDGKTALFLVKIEFSKKGANEVKAGAVAEKIVQPTETLEAEESKDVAANDDLDETREEKLVPIEKASEGKVQKQDSIVSPIKPKAKLIDLKSLQDDGDEDFPDDA